MAKICETCGKEYDDNFEKCPNCQPKDFPHKECQGCGKKLHKEAVTCPNCGFINKIEISDEKDKQSIWLNIISLFMPIIGFILYVVLLNKQPKKAEALLGWTITGAITGIILSLILGFSAAILYLSYLGFIS